MAAAATDAMRCGFATPLSTQPSDRLRFIAGYFAVSGVLAITVAATRAVQSIAASWITRRRWRSAR